MPRTVSPPIDELDSLRTPLNEGEQTVLNFFCEHLPEAWEIYIQPHLNGLRPDFVLLNPSAGIAVYEVKHWNLQAMPYRVERQNQSPKLWATNRQGVAFRVTDNPAHKIQLYRDNIINLYAPEIGNQLAAGKKSIYAIVTAGIIFTNASTEEAKHLTYPFFSEKNKRYCPVVGADLLKSRSDAVRILPDMKRTSSVYMSSEIVQQLRRWLVEPDFSREQRQPLKLNQKQQVLATTRTRSGRRRIRGAAGSGKSMVLASRAAVLSAEGKQVLVATFNITLWHYLRDLAVRYPVKGKRINGDITYTHFHEWCKEIIVNAGLKQEYDDLFKHPFDIEKVLEVEMVELANRAIDLIENDLCADDNYRYDAILIDEGQDYNIQWWKTLERVLRQDGEMVLVADEAQDLYKRARNWTETAMSGAGFSGPWNQLETCYRSPSGLIPYLKSFAEEFLPQSNIQLISPESSSLDLYPVEMRWIQTSREDMLAELCVDSLLDIPELADSKTVVYPDLVALLPNHKFGMEFVDILERRGRKCLHIFDEDEQRQRHKKKNFFMGDSQIKACTIHSFKGWEARYMTIGISGDISLRRNDNLAAAYVAMSRLRRNAEGSHITVVCSNPKLDSYGSTWPEFKRIGVQREQFSDIFF